LVLGDRLYMINDTGVISCLNALDGSKVWAKRQQGEYWASPFYSAGAPASLGEENSSGHIYFLSKEGKVLVISAGDDFELIAEKHFPAGFNASPAVVGNSLILRSFTHLYRIGK
jgi:outer membrane protein assembly factor BamB